MHHKRHRPKNQRSGCLMCKPHKMNGIVKTMHVKGQKGKLKRNAVIEREDGE